MRIITTLLALFTLTSWVWGACPTDCTTRVKSEIDFKCSNEPIRKEACVCQNFYQLFSCFQTCRDPESLNIASRLTAEYTQLCELKATPTEVKDNNNQNKGHSEEGNNKDNNHNHNNNDHKDGEKEHTQPTQVFQINSVGNDLLITAGGTKVIIPVNANVANTNTPVSGNSYSSYIYGSVTIGYVHATASASSGHFNSTLSSNGLSPAINFEYKLVGMALIPIILGFKL